MGLTSKAAWVQLKTRWMEQAEHILHWSLCGIAFFIPIATFPAVICGSVAIAMWICSGKLLKEKRKWLAQSWTPPILIMMLLPWIAIFWSVDPAVGYKDAQRNYFWLYAFAVASMDYQKYKRNPIIYSYLSGLTCTIFLSILQFIQLVPMPIIPKLNRGYATGFFSGPNSYLLYSLLLVAGMLVLSFLYKKEETQKVKIAFLLLLAACFFNLAIIPGRTGYLSFILLSPLILFNIIGKKHYFKISITTIAVLGLLFLSPVFQDRLEDAKTQVKEYFQKDKIDKPVNIRLYLWKKSIQIIRIHPLIGIGTGGFKKEMEQFKDSPNPEEDHPHNSFLDITVHYGLLGLSIFIWMILMIFLKGWQLRQSTVGFFLVTYILILIIGSLTDIPFLSLTTGSLFALLTGLTAGVHFKDSTKKEL